jgi:predicted RNA binding protein YcfA (HicA-like mRNA interferase family)
MTKRDKLRQKLRNPSADTNMRDIQTLLESFGFVLVRIRGSHYIFEYDDGEQSKQLVFPLHGNKVKRMYIKEVIKIIDELFPMEEEDDNDKNP